jgi:endo-1,4-beta-D-glucanase Y
MLSIRTLAFPVVFSLATAALGVAACAPAGGQSDAALAGGGGSGGGGGSSAVDGAGQDQQTTGGPGTGGTAGGDGGSLPYGFRPATVTDTEADTAYADWKAGFLEDCGGGLWRVKWSDATLTVSEGIGYGMLLTVIHDERAIFDGLWQYYKNNADPNGLMHWQRGGCAGTQSGDNAATDADLDAAMALVMASHRWSQVPYLADAQDLIGKIRTYETTTGAGGLGLLRPGDTFGGGDCLNFSYFAPAYYRVFAGVDAGQDAFWNKLAGDTYVLIARVANSSTGLVPNWCDENGASAASGPSGCAFYTNADQYGSDAARTPWRIATDYVWWGTAAAQPWLRQITGWVKSVGIAGIGGRYLLDGTAAATNHTVVTVGAFADAALAYDQATADEFFQEVATMAPQTTYFPLSLRALYLLLPLGRFTPEGGP